MLVPAPIKGIHDSLLNKFIQKGYFNNTSDMSVQGLGMHEQGFIFPVNFRLKMLPPSNEDFNVVGFFSLDEMDQNNYIFADNGGKITGMSKELFNLSFSNQNIFDLDLAVLMPNMSMDVFYKNDFFN